MEASVSAGTHDFTMASRKAEETAWRRFQAVQWLESLLGPLGISNQPSEREFISFLRNGLILCNAINKIHPGAVPKVVENQSPLQLLTRENQPLPAYQYFENVRNFLVAVEELKLPAFEASDLERDTMEAGSGAKVVDCILSLKSFHEGKQTTGANGFYKHAKSPSVVNAANRMHSRASAAISSDSCRRLDMSALCGRQLTSEGDNGKLEEYFVESIGKLLAEYMVGSKENIDDNLLASYRNRDMDPVKQFNRIMSSGLEEQPQDNFPEQQCKACLRKGNCHHRDLFKMQEKELLDLKGLLLETKKDFKGLQFQLQRDLKDLGTQVQELSTAALGYYRVVKENRTLYNMVQDLKGNIRVYCRIRPSFVAEAINVIDFIGEDDEVYKDTQPLIRSVMDGYNVCIFAYGQTGSGKTHTMSGPSGGLTRDMGINYLALNDLFRISNGRKDIISYEIQVQMVEIYNEQVRDLLAEDSSTVKYPFLDIHKLEIRSCTSDNGLSLPDATVRSVKSTNDVLNLMKLGEVNRVVSSTGMNDRSSRSHCVLTVHVHGKDESGGKFHSRLHLVDLAGSERVDKSEVTGDRLKEAQYINRSLSCLGDVITALAQKNSHIPYRNSKLTLLLQDSLGGHAKTLMLAHVSPEEDSFSETITTLKFAQRVSTVELGAAHSNKESSEVMQLKEQIESLKQALANKEAQNVRLSKTCEKPRTILERTPPRPRRLSIENCGNVKNVKAMNSEDKKGGPKTPSLPNRSRRLSSDGPSLLRRITLRPETVLINKYGHCQTQDEEAITKPFGHLDNGSFLLAKAPRSPTSATFQKRVTKQMILKTPNHKCATKSEVKMKKLTLSTDNLTTPYMVNDSTNGKGSHIRKSLRSTIGKLINGSEKRVSKINDGKSPVTSSARSLRRQSLTGIQTSGSRRSSLGGKPDDNCAKDTRNAKTPPPVHRSTKLTSQWLSSVDVLATAPVHVLLRYFDN
ncbi:hypothetical protein FNV43_RR17008 [Rhamnella rubrinervis]|uniref:Kinesin-like protein n=1 Tax=Rhamnella rubrinervis TaxID=2594499 RepID=A0A8K0GZS6_9ROSA|nr:hypothetical protein FNV43_RR17008 [Rhamnella rubrinervis]